MSLEATTWALTLAPDVPPQTMTVLLGLANHAHANGRGAYPSQDRLAWYARKTVRSVRNDLAELERLGLIRRGDQRHVAFMPPDRRPVVWDLAIERRREVPTHLDPAAEPRSGTTTEPVDNRAEAGFRAVLNRPEAQYRTAGSQVPDGRKRASDEPSRTFKNSLRAPAPSRAGGAALPPAAGTARCAKHPTQLAHTCPTCRSEALGGSR
ncbi:helix-turn-helix domain-containing protein [Dactylosporangium sp. NPDC006015]|uniref:helix-turn-helix domain-containing protein n=1 Tax=Dactylosporangium sp. NPDC006015 TaxID=3154576 RepID=UPI0033A2D8C0